MMKLHMIKYYMQQRKKLENAMIVKQLCFSVNTTTFYFISIFPLL
jgi:hypothetical protein